MKPKIGQKLTYVDESCTEYTAIVTEIFTHQDGHKTVNIEYRHVDRTTRKLNGLPFIDGAHNPESTQKVMCFSKRTPKKAKPEPIPDPSNAQKPKETKQETTEPEPSDENPVVSGTVTLSNEITVSKTETLAETDNSA